VTNSDEWKANRDREKTRSPGRQPDFHVSALRRGTQGRYDCKNNRIGGAWKNEDGTIDILLDCFIKLEQQGDLSIKLFSNRRKSAEAPPSETHYPQTEGFDDDIPF